MKIKNRPLRWIYVWSASCNWVCKLAGLWLLHRMVYPRQSLIWLVRHLESTPDESRILPTFPDIQRSPLLGGFKA